MNDRTTLKPLRNRNAPAPLITRASELLHYVAMRAAPAIIIGLTLFFLFRPIYAFKSDAERQEYLRRIGARTDTRVIALTTEWCPACKQLERELLAEHVDFLQLDIEKTQAGSELFRKISSQTLSNSVPKIIIDNKVVGTTRALEAIRNLKRSDK